MPEPKPNLQPDAQSVVSQERIEQTIRLRYSPFPELTMEILSRQLNQFRTGELRPAARTWEIMFERDGELAGPALKRFADASRLPWEIEKADDSKEADQDCAALHYFYANLTATSVLEQNDVGGANLLFRQMMTAKAYRYSNHEILLRINNAAKAEVTAQFNHTPVWFFENRRGYLAYLPGELDFWGQKLESGQWLSAVGEGLMRPCSVLYGIKHFALRDNLLFSSRFGLPGIHGEFSGDMNSEGGIAFADALKVFANDWVTATYGGVGQAKITLIEAAKGGTGTLPFQELIERADRGYAKMFRGGDLSTQSRDKAAVGASVQGDESTLLLEDDAQWLSDTCNVRIDEPIIAYLFNREPKAWLRVRVPKKPEADLEINTLNAAGTLGIPVSIKTARERLQLPEPEAGEPLISIAPVVAAADSSRLERLALGNSAEDHVQKFAMAVASDILPVLKAADERLQRIVTITDPALRKQKWDEAWAELEPLRTGILADPTSGRVLEQISAKALQDGLEGREPATALGNFAQDQPRDNLGMWVDGNGGGLSEKENLKRGDKAMDRAIRQKADVQKAMHRKEVGQIDFKYGTPGDKANDFKGGFGVSHIVAKHGEETARQLPEVIARGKITPHEEENRRYVNHGDSMAVLERKNSQSAFVITSFEPKKKS